MYIAYDPNNVTDGFEKMWKKLIRKVKYNLTQEEKSKIDSFLTIDIDELLNLRKFYSEENERYIKKLNKYEAEFGPLFRQETSASGTKDLRIFIRSNDLSIHEQITEAILQQVKSALYIKWLNNAIVYNEKLSNKTISRPKIKNKKLTVKKIDNYQVLIKAYTEVVKDILYCEPQIKTLQEYSELSKTEISRCMKDLFFLQLLRKELGKKINYAKRSEKRELWIHAEKVIWDRMIKLDIHYTQEKEKQIDPTKMDYIRSKHKRRTKEDDDDNGDESE